MVSISLESQCGPVLWSVHHCVVSADQCNGKYIIGKSVETSAMVSTSLCSQCGPVLW